MICDILKRYDECKTTNFVSRSLVDHRSFTRKLQSKYILENQPRNIEMKTKRKKTCSVKLLEIRQARVQLILHGEKYFSLTGDISCNRQYLHN